MSIPIIEGRTVHRYCDPDAKETNEPDENKFLFRDPVNGVIKGMAFG